MGVEVMITIIDYGFAGKNILNKKVHTHGCTLIQVSVLEAKKVYHYTSFNHCQSLEKPRIIMRKLNLTKGRF